MYSRTSKDTSNDTTSRRIGTHTNVPPENWRYINTRRGPKYDVYGFGILLWELLTQQQAFADQDGSPGSFLWHIDSLTTANLLPLLLLFFSLKRFI